jgi:hypothetical protein
MLTEAEITYIENVKSNLVGLVSSKKVAIEFQKIRNRVEKTKDKNCMCGVVYRKIYIKAFLEWYESLA